MRIYRKTVARRRAIIRVVLGRCVRGRGNLYRLRAAGVRVETLAEAMRRFWDEDL